MHARLAETLRRVASRTYGAGRDVAAVKGELSLNDAADVVRAVSAAVVSLASLTAIAGSIESVVDVMPEQAARLREASTLLLAAAPLVRDVERALPQASFGAEYHRVAVARQRQADRITAGLPVQPVLVVPNGSGQYIGDGQRRRARKAAATE